VVLTDKEQIPGNEPNAPQDLFGGVAPGDLGIDTPIYEPEESTPLEEHETEGPVPPAVLWAMKDRRHFHLLPEHRGAKRIRAAVGVGDNTVYVIDDGHSHCMISRRVGSSPDGITYCLVARIPVARYRQFASGELPLSGVFANAHDLELCGVFLDKRDVSNILPIRHFAHTEDVPGEYLPSSPFIAFSEALSVDP
jgi:hypothetical protein